MMTKAKSIRAFIGAKDFEVSINFYSELGFQETILIPNLSVFKVDGLVFYLQDAFIQDWIDNTILFLEVEHVNQFWKSLPELSLTTK